MEYLQYVHYMENPDMFVQVLNLIINGIPSIHLIKNMVRLEAVLVLNLIINGIPSIQ